MIRHSISVALAERILAELPPEDEDLLCLRPLSALLSGLVARVRMLRSEMIPDDHERIGVLNVLARLQCRVANGVSVEEAIACERKRILDGLG